MPMSPRLLRPLASRSLSDADATAYLAAVEAADGQALEPAVRNAVTAFVIGCKSDGIWDSIKASCILAGARTLAGALVPLKGAAPTNNNFTASDYNRETGLVGDGSTTYLDSNRANDDDPEDDQHLSAYVSTAATNAFSIYIGASDPATAGASQLGQNTTAGQLFCRSRNSLADVGSNPAITNLSTGFLAISRNDGAAFVLRASSVSETLSRSSETPSVQNVGVFFRPGASTGYSDGRIAFYSIGESLDLAALDTRVSALITAIGNAI